MKPTHFTRTAQARYGKKAGFSMIEIMVVVGIMATLLVMGAPTLSAVFSSSKLGQGSIDVVNFLHIAHQTALKENRSVEVRFYKFEDPDTPQKDDLYQAYRMFVLPQPTRASTRLKCVQKAKARSNACPAAPLSQKIKACPA
jgi:uncharacterized protein (TIGR02596 family)